MFPFVPHELISPFYSLITSYRHLFTLLWQHTAVSFNRKLFVSVSSTCNLNWKFHILPITKSSSLWLGILCCLQLFLPWCLLFTKSLFTLIWSKHLVWEEVPLIMTFWIEWSLKALWFISFPPLTDCLLSFKSCCIITSFYLLLIFSCLLVNGIVIPFLWLVYTPLSK